MPEKNKDSQPDMPDEIIKRSVSISGHRTSISVEKEFWDLFCQMAEDQSISINTLISRLDEERSGNLSSAVRLYVLRKLLEMSE
ncbi:ribbon-helix-helix domain-containing protein [Sneathiella aquimaris]|uniref:ribbon-helix-helix domain-containing protein n=1 Tax=Sneathiella aquimaris TaxID=2599305 RepID=UPI001C686F24|nr:ribbon-helix-helix domain-containing protein [Sneathiella aquimaris]